MELGFAFGRAGSRVTVLQAGEHRPAGGGRLKMRDALLALAGGARVEVRTRRSASPGSHGDLTVEAESVAVESGSRPTPSSSPPAGRPTRPTSGSSGPALRSSAARLRVNEFLQSTSAPHVYAAGDVTGHAPTHAGGLVRGTARRGERAPG